MPEHTIHLFSEHLIINESNRILQLFICTSKHNRFTCCLIFKSDNALFSLANNFQCPLPRPFIHIPFISPIENLKLKLMETYNLQMYKQKVFCCRLNAEYNNFFDIQHMNLDKIRQHNDFLSSHYCRGTWNNKNSCNM